MIEGLPGGKSADIRMDRLAETVALMTPSGR